MNLKFDQVCPECGKFLERMQQDIKKFPTERGTLYAELEDWPTEERKITYYCECGYEKKLSF